MICEDIARRPGPHFAPTRCRSRFAAVTINHLIIDDFLPAADHAALIAYALAHPERFEPSLVRREGQGTRAAGRISLLHAGPLGELGARFEAAILGRKDELFAATGTPPFEIERCESELSVHRDGGFYKPHQDTFTGHDRDAMKSDRLVTAVYYFHRQPKGFTGGEIALYPFRPGKPLLVEPRDNRLVAFPSFALHEVLPVTCPGDDFASARFSINCWLRRAKG